MTAEEGDDGSSEETERVLTLFYCSDEMQLHAFHCNALTKHCSESEMSITIITLSLAQ